MGENKSENESIIGNLNGCEEIADRVRAKLLELLDDQKYSLTVREKLPAIAEAVVVSRDLKDKLSQIDDMLLRVLQAFGVE